MDVVSCTCVSIKAWNGMHIDKHESSVRGEDKVTSIIIPIKLAHGSQPELFLADDLSESVQYKYPKDEALILPSEQFHLCAFCRGH